ncbi:MAG: threonylcarbamoyl-AMP synthase [Candidatus Rokubacteria bacterium]|nr:threonylcarbamoyl-AMP synthase [Candidatus Rokubacteria bacterium]
METHVRAVEPAAPSPAVLAEAAVVLAAGGVVAFPTETFYGLAVRALDAAAVARLFALKGRPRSSPILVLVDTPARIAAFAHVSDVARALMARHWPGALTLVLRAGAGVPPELTAGTGTVGVRQPGHAVARGLAAAADGPITAPSANLTGEPPPTTAAEVRRVFDGRIELILDGGPTPGGAPSTVLDVTVDPPRVIRAGAVAV